MVCPMQRMDETAHIATLLGEMTIGPQSGARHKQSGQVIGEATINNVPHAVIWNPGVPTLRSLPGGFGSLALESMIMVLSLDMEQPTLQ